MLVHAVMPVFAMMPMSIRAFELAHIGQTFDIWWYRLCPDATYVVLAGSH